MNYKKYILVAAFALTVVISCYGSFWLEQRRTHSLRVEEAVKSIKDTLLSDPNYIVTEYTLVKAIQPDMSNPGSFLDRLNEGLQVTVRKLGRHGPPNWSIKLDRILRRLPRFLRPSASLYLHPADYYWIGITVVEPTPDEFERLKKQVLSLGIARDIRIDINPHFPDTEDNQLSSGRWSDGAAIAR